MLQDPWLKAGAGVSISKNDLERKKPLKFEEASEPGAPEFSNRSLAGPRLLLSPRRSLVTPGRFYSVTNQYQSLERIQVGYNPKLDLSQRVRGDSPPWKDTRERRRLGESRVEGSGG